MHSCNISMLRHDQGLNCFREIEVDVLIQNADLVITGEGHSDRQTLMGKLPQRILEHVTNQKIWLVSGGVSDRKAMLDAGLIELFRLLLKKCHWMRR